MSIVSASKALQQYIYSIIGESVTENGTTFNYYNSPPEDLNQNYIWLNVTPVDDVGPRDSYLQNLLAVFTVVTPINVNRNSKDAALNGVQAVMKLFSGRGLQEQFTTSQGETVTIVSQRLVGGSEGSEEVGQKKLIYEKVNINYQISF